MMARGKVQGRVLVGREGAVTVRVSVGVKELKLRAVGAPKARPAGRREVCSTCTMHLAKVLPERCGGIVCRALLGGEYVLGD